MPLYIGRTPGIVVILINQVTTQLSCQNRKEMTNLLL